MVRCGPFPILGLVAIGAGVLCVASVVVLTFLLPGGGSYPTGGGFMPIPVSAR